MNELQQAATQKNRKVDFKVVAEYERLLAACHGLVTSGRGADYNIEPPLGTNMSLRRGSNEPEDEQIADLENDE